jgi:predicted metal-dependent hydrolase
MREDEGLFAGFEEVRCDREGWGKRMPAPSQRAPTVHPMADTVEDPTLFQPHVEVRISSRRKKTAGAHWEGDRIVVVVPSHLRGDARDQMVDELAGRLRRHRPYLDASDEELRERALDLGRRYLDGVVPSTIRWSRTQTKRWGSCTVTTGDVRISERLRVVPTWVLDAVIVHELAHIIEATHSPRFRELEDRYPRQKEAEHFLEGYALGLESRTGAGANGNGNGHPTNCWSAPPRPAVPEPSA